MINRRRLYCGSFTASLVIVSAFFLQVHAEEVKSGDRANRQKKIERPGFRIAQFNVTPLEYHQSENKKFRLRGFIDVVEQGTEPEEISLSGSPGSTIPRAFSLSQNYPNPFNPTTTITFDVPGEEGEGRQVKLTIYDLRGRNVRTIVDVECEPGRHRVVWNGRNDRGQRVASGVYLCTLRSDAKIFTRKMVMMK